MPDVCSVWVAHPLHVSHSKARYEKHIRQQEIAQLKHHRANKTAEETRAERDEAYFENFKGQFKILVCTS